MGQAYMVDDVSWLLNERLLLLLQLRICSLEHMRLLGGFVVLLGLHFWYIKVKSSPLCF
jgi:hypothetical protein